MTAKLPDRKTIRLKDYDYSQSGYYFVTICTQDRIHRFGKIENREMIPNDTGKMVQLAWLGLPEQFPSVTLDTFQIMPNHIHAIIIINNPVVGTPLVGVRNTPGVRNTTNETVVDSDATNETVVDSDATNETVVVDNAPNETVVDRNATVVDRCEQNNTFVDRCKSDETMGDCCESNGVGVGTGTGARARVGQRTGTRPVPTLDAGGDDMLYKTLGNVVGAFKSIITQRYCNGVKLGLVPPFDKRLLQFRFHDHIIRNETELFRIRHYIKNNPANWHNDKMNPLDHDMVNETSALYGDELWQV